MAPILILCLLLFSVPRVHGEEEAFMAHRAIRISDTEVVVEFTMPLNDKGISHPYTALRRCHVTPKGECDGLAWDGDTPLQKSKSDWAFYKGDRQRVVITFSKEALDDYLSTSHPYYEQGYRTFLCMEELSPPDDDDPETLFDVISQSGVELYSSFPGSPSSWNGTYLPIEVDYEYTPGKIPSVTLPPPPAPITDIVTFPLLPESEGEAQTDAPETEEGCGAVLSPAVFLIPAALISCVALGKRKR